MKPFAFERATDPINATTRYAPDASYIAGGTNLVDLMKDDVAQPARLIDISRLPLAAVDATPAGITLGALARMSDVADHPDVVARFPIVAQALLAGASPQLRNMATIGGNVLQRTRCAYFRDIAQACNKREPGSGCGALGGVNRSHAVIGTSDACIATNPSDLAVALVAVDAVVHVLGRDGSEKSIPIGEFYRLPGATPWIETALAPGDLITAVVLPESPRAKRSFYLKIRDRASYEFALVAVGVSLEREAKTIRSARVVLGAVAPMPWRSSEAETILVGSTGDAATLARAATAATATMRGFGENDFKIELSRRAIVRALETVTA